jgi:CheY-like chemotaxis protein
MTTPMAMLLGVGLGLVIGLLIGWLIRGTRQAAAVPAPGPPPVRRAARSSEPAIRPQSADAQEREVAAGWLRFLRQEVADTVNAVNNRLQVIRILAAGVDRTSLDPAQIQALNQIDVEVGRASGSAASLHRHVTSSAPEPSRPSVATARPRAVRSGVILVVEGDDAGREALGQVFRNFGHRVIPARDGLEAFAVLQQEPVDCVITDTRMSRLSGMALYTQVEDRLPTLARRFVFVSGDTQEPDTRAFLERVGCPVLPKPFDVQLLIEAVTEILERPAPAGG